MKKQINTRKDGVAKDMVADKGKHVQTYSFPKLRISVEADSYANALEKAKKIIKNRK